MTDQQKASATSVYGNPFVPCPFMDRMAEQGLTFRDTYAPASICTPSRASVMTGVHPLVHQVTCHQNRAPYNLDQLPELLARSGYYTTVVGHHEYDRDLDRGLASPDQHVDSRTYWNGCRVLLRTGAGGLWLGLGSARMHCRGRTCSRRGHACHQPTRLDSGQRRTFLSARALPGAASSLLLPAPLRHPG